MPTGNLPKEGADLHKEVYDKQLAKCKDGGGDEKTCAESAAKQAWGAVRQAGWKKGADGTWSKSLVVKEFSLRIDKASHDKATGENRWSAIASDTESDLYNDSMSMELFSNFVVKIEDDTKVPEEYRSAFWDGGMPYLSVSHYMDLNGKGVPGDIQKLYIDGNRLKAKGTYFNTPLGLACYRAIEQDLYSEAGKGNSNKVRVSIAFLDYKHKHKSNGYEYDRLTAKSICPECLSELISGESQGKIFLDGQLIHLAHTRVPVNERTAMEVEKSMPKTRKEDAESIVGAELADMLEDENSVVGKSDAIIIRADEDEVVDDTANDEGASEVTAAVDETTNQEQEAIEETTEEVILEDGQTAVIEDSVIRAVTKTEGGCAHPPSHYLVAEDSQHPTTWHMLVKNCSGSYDRGHASAAYAALTSNHRGHAYAGPNKSGALSKLHSIYNSQGWQWPSENKAELRSVIEEVIEEMQTPIEAHPLDAAIAELKAKYDEIKSSASTEDDKLRAIQEPFSALGEVIKSNMVAPVAPVDEAVSAEANDLVAAFSLALKPLADKMELISTQLSQQALAPLSRTPVETPAAPVIPTPRNITPTVKPILPFDTGASTGVQKSATPGLRAIIERNT